MAFVQEKSCSLEDIILKCNLWKFFKALRAQANPLYCLLAASPIECAWITISERGTDETSLRISITQFLTTHNTLPSTGNQYRLNMRLYDSACGELAYTINSRSELAVERLEPLLSAFVGALCGYYKSKGTRLELTPATINRFKIKARYIGELQSLFESANRALEGDINSNKQFV